MLSLSSTNSGASPGNYFVGALRTYSTTLWDQERFQKSKTDVTFATDEIPPWLEAESAYKQRHTNKSLEFPAQISACTNARGLVFVPIVLSSYSTIHAIAILLREIVDARLHQADVEKSSSKKLTPYELIKDLIGSIDSSAPDSNPMAQPHSTPVGRFVAEKLKKQGLKIP